MPRILGHYDDMRRGGSLVHCPCPVLVSGHGVVGALLAHATNRGSLARDAHFCILTAPFTSTAILFAVWLHEIVKILIWTASVLYIKVSR